MSVRELLNRLVSDPNDGGNKDDRDEDGNIIISYLTLHSLLPTQIKKCPHITRSCVVVNVEFLLKVYIHHCYTGVIGIGKKSNIESKMLKAEGLVRNPITYKHHIKIQ